MLCTMKLYGYYRSSASYRVRIILNIKGIDWENRPILLNRDEHREESFLRINPMGFVPVLDDGGTILAQSPAIAEVLEEQHPSPPLLPDDPIDRARVREMMGIVGCDIHPLQNLRVLKFLRAEFGQDDNGVASWSRHWIAAGFDAFEKLAAERSSDGSYSFGESITLADVWLLPQVYNAERFDLDLAPYPTIVSVSKHCLEVPAVREAHPSRQPDAPAQ